MGISCLPFVRTAPTEAMGAENFGMDITGPARCHWRGQDLRDARTGSWAENSVVSIAATRAFWPVHMRAKEGMSWGSCRTFHKTSKAGSTKHQIRSLHFCKCPPGDSSR